MNIPLQFTWRYDTLPSVEALLLRTELPEEALQAHLQQPVEPFDVTMNLFLDRTMKRPFLGGTILSLLHFLYDLYQEPMSVEELTPVLEYPQPHVVERFRGYIDRVLAGGLVLRREMLYPNTILTRIRRNKTVIEWE
jgi:hypothetical protein